jgi:hypothetical protein
MARHTKHVPSDLDDALEHVVYEMWKYKQSVAHYSEIYAAGSDAAIEFRVLHHRVLLEFFYHSDGHPDNILAWEYVHDWRQTHNPASLPWLAGYLDRCHTMLAHTSKTRTEMENRGLKVWGQEWETVEPHLDQTISEFLGALSADHKATCRKWINRWLNGPYPFNEVLTKLAPLVR